MQCTALASGGQHAATYPGWPRLSQRSKAACTLAARPREHRARARWARVGAAAASASAASSSPGNPARDKRSANALPAQLEHRRAMGHEGRVRGIEIESDDVNLAPAPLAAEFHARHEPDAIPHA